MDFEQEKIDRIALNSKDESLVQAGFQFVMHSARSKYCYNFSWLDRPIIQYPQDMVAVQELIWQIRPDLIIETGIAHGGSLILSASMLALLDYCDAVSAGIMLDPKATGGRKVLGIDIDIRSHNKEAIEKHPLSHKISMLQGSSIDESVVNEVRDYAKNYRRVLVFLDSNHTHEHVLAELEAYAPLTSQGSYCVVFDTLVEDMPDDMYPDRLWGRGNNPKTAVRDYMEILRNEGRQGIDGGKLEFEVDKTIENKLLITVSPDGYLRRV